MGVGSTCRPSFSCCTSPSSDVCQFLLYPGAEACQAPPRLGHPYLFVRRGSYSAAGVPRGLLEQLLAHPDGAEVAQPVGRRAQAEVKTAPQGGSRPPAPSGSPPPRKGAGSQEPGGEAPGGDPGA
jgi:hypothetical protein